MQGIIEPSPRLLRPRGLIKTQILTGLGIDQKATGLSLCFLCLSRFNKNTAALRTTHYSHLPFDTQLLPRLGGD